MKVLIVDCYDSFTFNLYQQVGKLGGDPVVLPCDTPLEELKKAGCRPDYSFARTGNSRGFRSVSLKYWRP